MELEKLDLCGDFPLDKDPLAKLLWVAPKKLEISLNVFLSPDVSISFVAPGWSSCPLEDLDIENPCNFNDNDFVTLLTRLSKMNSLNDAQ